MVTLSSFFFLEPFRYLFSEQNRSCTAEGEPGKENGLMKLKDIFQHEQAWPKSCAMKILKVKKKVGIKSMVLR